MTDQELLDALSVLARRFGLLERGQRLTIVGDPRDEQPTPAPPRLSSVDWSEVELTTESAEIRCRGAVGCIHVNGHKGDHETPKRCDVAARMTGGAWTCRREPGHDGPCAALETSLRDPAPSVADAALMVEYGAAKVAENARRAGFGPAPESVTVSYGVGRTAPLCGAQASDLPGALVCDLPRGHAGDHATACGAVNAAENPVMAGQVCSLPRGHEGSHEATVNGQRWVFGMRKVCTLPAGCEWPERCMLGGCQAPDPTTSRA